MAVHIFIIRVVIKRIHLIDLPLSLNSIHFAFI